MLMTYARRELSRRHKQTIVVAVGLAIAVALLMVVNSVSSGVSKAQSQVLASVYGVGTDITVTQKPTTSASSNQSFGFGQGAGNSDSQGNTSVSSTTLRAGRDSETFADSQLATVQKVSGVSNAVSALVLEQTTFNGQIGAEGSSGSSASPSAEPTGSSSSQSSGESSSSGERRRFGGGQFNLNSITVTGVTPGSTLGPLSTTTVSSGRTLATSDNGQDVALVSSTYAKTNSIALNATVSVGGTNVTVVGIVDSTSSSVSDIFLPLDTTQKIANLSGKINEIYVQAANSGQVDSVATAIGKALPSATVSTDKTLAESVSGSLASAATLVGSLGKWLSVGVLAVAFGLAILFTVSGVNQRTRDFGTLKSIGWSNRRVVTQVAVESLLRAAVGAVAGVVLGLVAILVLNRMGITLSGSTGGFSVRGARSGSGGGGSAPDGAPTASGGSGGTGGQSGGGTMERASSAVNVVLHNPVSVETILIGLAAALIGGLLAGIIGGWRAARLRPAAALRSVE